MLGEKKMNVTLYAYNLFEKRIREKGKKDVEYFENRQKHNYRYYRQNFRG